MTIAIDYARGTAAAAAKELRRIGGGVNAAPELLLARLFEQADIYDAWHLHATRERMATLLRAEWHKALGRALGGHVSAAVRRSR